MTERFFIGEKINGSQVELVISNVALIHQIGKVLRKKAGDKVVFLDNSGYEFECEIRQLTPKLALFKILKKEKNVNEPSLRVSLYQSLLKKDKMELVFEKCTELGVLHFYPVVSEYSVKLAFNAERAKKILKESAEQSQRGVVPELFKIEKFKDSVSGSRKEVLNIIFHEKEKEGNALDFLILNKEKIGNANEVNIFVGPEGGFSENEVKLAKDAGFEVLSLGKRVLRAETAAVAASAIFLMNK